jgi:hypothetical protein
MLAHDPLRAAAGRGTRMLVERGIGAVFGLMQDLFG